MKHLIGEEIIDISGTIFKVKGVSPNLIHVDTDSLSMWITYDKLFEKYKLPIIMIKIDKQWLDEKLMHLRKRVKCEIVEPEIDSITWLISECDIGLLGYTIDEFVVHKRLTFLEKTRAMHEMAEEYGDTITYNKKISCLESILQVAEKLQNEEVYDELN